MYILYIDFVKKIKLIIHKKESFYIYEIHLFFTMRYFLENETIKIQFRHFC